MRGLGAREPRAHGAFLGDAGYVNYLADDDPSDAVAMAYGPNYARLRALKARFDPDNLFRMNQNIPPLPA